MEKKYLIKTLGCKANFSDSQVIESELKRRGWAPSLVSGSHSDFDLCIINSCTVTDEADKQTRRLAKRLAKENPQAKILVTGCGAEVNPEAMAEAPGVSYVIGNQNKNQLVEIITSHILNHPSPPNSNDLKEKNQPLKGEILGTVSNYTDIISRHPMDREWPAAQSAFGEEGSGPENHSISEGQTQTTRAFLKVQEGCNSFCTYCIIPYGRGPARSIRPREILSQVRTLVENETREVVITGTNIGDYGVDWGDGPQLDQLLEMILSETQLERLRVSSLDPTEITPRMIALMEANPRFCPHFHVSLQSPHSRILRLMKRKYSYDDVEACLNRIAQIRVPTVGRPFVGMDIITGFPGETDEEFEWGYERLSQLPWARLHVFPYSERSGTPATRLPSSVPQHIRSQRAKRLMALSLERLTRIYRQTLENCKSNHLSLDSILIERAQPNGWVGGYTPSYLRVLFPPGTQVTHLKRNQLIRAKPIDVVVDSSAGDVGMLCSLDLGDPASRADERAATNSDDLS